MRAANPSPEKVWESVFARRPDAVLVSQGGAYCGLGLAGLPQWLRQSGVPYVPLCQSARSQWLVDESLRGRATEYFAAAARLAFVSAVNCVNVKLQLAAPLRHAVVVQNPAGCSPELPFPWPLSDGAKLVCVARLEVDDKGQDLLLQALAEPVWRERDFTLTFYGQGRDEAYLKRLGDYLGISTSIRWGGLLRGTAGIWEKCQLLVLPSRSEGTPLVLLEAMAAGRPALVTAVDGNLEWVEDGVTGFVAEAPTVRHLASALERAWGARGNWIEMGSAARARFLARRDPDPAETLLQVLTSVAQTKA
jgi:glycosyltransferase involved in cell wall biosynthesis